MWLSPAWWGNRFLYGIRVLNCDYSRVTRVSSTSYEPPMFAHFWLRRGRMMLRPHLYFLPSRFTLVRSLYWVLGFCGVRPGYCCVGDDRCADSSASLAQCCSCAVFFRSFVIFALVWGLLFFLRNFCFSSLPTLLVLPFLLRLSFLLFSLSSGG